MVTSEGDDEVHPDRVPESTLEDSLFEFEASLIEKGYISGRNEGIQRAFNEGLAAGTTKGRDLAIEFGFYKGILVTLKRLRGPDKSAVSDHNFALGDERLQLNTFSNSSTADPSDLCSSNSKRWTEVELIRARNKQENVRVLCDSLEGFLDDLFENLEEFSDLTFQKMVKIRAKFKVLESRLGLVLDVMPDLASLRPNDTKPDDATIQGQLSF